MTITTALNPNRRHISGTHSSSSSERDGGSLARAQITNIEVPSFVRKPDAVGSYIAPRPATAVTYKYDNSRMVPPAWDEAKRSLIDDKYLNLA